MVKAKGRNHPYLELEGEALNDHMMAMHGWSMQMVAVNGHPDASAEVQLHRGHAPQGTPPCAPCRACGRGLSSRLSTRLPVHGPSTRSLSRWAL